MRRAVLAIVTAVALLVGTGAVPSAAEPEPSARTVTFPGKGVKVHPGEVGKLRKTSPSFRTLARKRLEVASRRHRCGADAVITVKRWSSEGFAQVQECTYGRGFRVYVQSGKTWLSSGTLTLSRGSTFCWSLRWYAVPSDFATKRCLDENEQVRAYADYQLAPDYGTAAYAARVVVGAATRQQYELGVGNIWSADLDSEGKLYVLSTLHEMVEDGATLTLPRCFDRTDPELGSRLGEGEEGCLLDAFYGNYRALYLLHLAPYQEGHWRATELTALASS